MNLVHAVPMKKMWDKFGIALSGACLLHCILIGLLPLLMPAVELFIHTPWIHRAFAFFILITTPLAFIPGFRSHRSTLVLLAAALGLMAIMIGVFQDGLWEENLVHAISIGGSLLLVWGHWQNLRLRRSC